MAKNISVPTGFVIEEENKIPNGFVIENQTNNNQMQKSKNSFAFDNNNETEYQKVLNNPYLTKEQKASEINRIGEAERIAIDSENKKAQDRIKRGSALQVASGLPILNIPYVGTGIGGALFEAGNSIMQGNKADKIWDDATKGFIVGETIGAIPYVGKYVGKTKAGQSVINKASGLVAPALNNPLAQKVGEVLKKEIPLPSPAKQNKTQSINPNTSIIKPLPEQKKTVKKPNTAVKEVPQGFEIEPIASSDTQKRSLEQSILNAKGTPKQIKNIIKEEAPTYNVLHNEDLIKQAVKEIEADFPNELSRLSTAKEFNALDFEKSRQIAKRLFDNGEYKQAINLIDNVSENATKKGQAIQSLSLWSNMTPEGAVYKAQKIITEYNKKVPADKQIKLTQENIEAIRELQKQALNSQTELEKTQALAKSMKYISELVPKNALQKLKSYRNIALLLNPKTLGRNIIGNALFNSIDNVSKALAVPFDKAISSYTGKTTRVLPQMKEYFAGMGKGAKVGFQEALQGIDTRGLGQRFDLGTGRTFQNKPLQTLETALDIGLRTPDRAFYEATFRESVANMMKAQGLKTPTQEILKQAEKEALESVFQNESKLSQMALQTREALNNIGTKDFGAGDVLIPYAQTPANLAQQGINYSPLGYLKGIGNLTQGNQRQASLDLARATVGTGLIGGGYGLAKAGMMTPSQFDDNYTTNKRIKENFQPLGIRPDQIGDVWYSPFQPMSIPLSVGNAIANGEDPLQAGINTVVELPFLQGVARGLKDLQEGNYSDAGLNVISSIPSQFTPSLGGQIAQLIDPYQRELYSPNKMQYGINQAISKIPFASKTLPEKIDVTGQQIERYSSQGGRRLFDILLNPTFVNEKKEDFVLDELKGLYDNTKETKHLLPIVNKKISYVDANGNNQQIQLTGEQVSEYQKALGQMNYKAVNELIQKPYYQSLTKEEKIKEINKIYSQNNQLVKNSLFGIPLPKKKQTTLLQRKRENITRKRNKIHK